MATVLLSPSPILQFFNNSGQPNAGGSLLTQVGGVNYPTYQDSAGTIPLPNPIPLNARGEVSNSSGTSVQLFLTAGVTYTFTLYDANNNQLNQSTYVVPLGSFTPGSNSLLTGTNLSIQTAINDITDKNLGSSYIGYDQGGTGAVARTIQSKLQEIVSVKDFGAVGDGVTDDTAAIQAAYNALSTSLGTVYFPIGKYKVTSQINIPSGINTTGEGYSSQILNNVPNTGINYNAGPACLSFAGEGSISDIRVTGTTNTAHGIAIINGHYWKIERVVSEYNGGHGFWFQGSWDGICIRTNAAYNNYDGYYAGTNVNGGCNALCLLNIESQWNNNAGIELIGLNNASIIASAIEQNYQQGIILSAAHNVSIISPFMEANSKSAAPGINQCAIIVGNGVACYNTEISGYFHSNGSYAISLQASSENTRINNFTSANHTVAAVYVDPTCINPFVGYNQLGADPTLLNDSSNIAHQNVTFEHSIQLYGPEPTGQSTSSTTYVNFGNGTPIPGTNYPLIQFNSNNFFGVRYWLVEIAFENSVAGDGVQFQVVDLTNNQNIGPAITATATSANTRYIVRSSSFQMPTMTISLATFKAIFATITGGTATVYNVRLIGVV